MPQMSNHDFKEKYYYVDAGTIEPIHIKDIMTKTRLFVVR